MSSREVKVSNHLLGGPILIPPKLLKATSLQLNSATTPKVPTSQTLPVGGQYYLFLIAVVWNLRP